MLDLTALVRIRQPEGVGVAIQKNCGPNDSVVIVCHGTPTELLIPIGFGSKVAVSQTSLQVLNEALRDPSADNDALGAACGFLTQSSLEHFYRLLAFFVNIRKLHLRHVAFRACKIGQSIGLLANAQQVFNAGSVSAPKKRDFFAQVTPKIISTKEYDKLVHHFPDGYTFGPPGLRVYISYQMTGPHSAAVGFKAESVEAIRNFMSEKFSFVNEHLYTRGGKLGLHGLWNEGAPPYFFFPNDPGYSANIETFSEPICLPLPPLAPPTDASGGRHGIVERFRERIQKRREHA